MKSIEEVEQRLFQAEHSLNITEWVRALREKSILERWVHLGGPVEIIVSMEMYDRIVESVSINNPLFPEDGTIRFRGYLIRSR